MSEKPVRRFGQILKVRPEHEAEYIRYHEAVWPSVLDLIRECNIQNYSIFLRDHLLFAYFEYIGDDYAADMQKMAANQAMQRWWAIMEPMQDALATCTAGEWWAKAQEVFHTD